MKLRNKKTGEIKEWQRVGAIDYGEMNEVYDSAEYNSLAELNEEWEDYIEPYIEDEKIRKFVRDWAKFNEIEKACIQRLADNDNSYKILGNDKEARCAWAIYIHASYSETVRKDYNCDGPMIPIAELVGEEAE